MRGEVFVVKESEGKIGFSGTVILFFHEGVEAGDGGFGERRHGTGAVEDIGDFGELVFHGFSGWDELT